MMLFTNFWEASFCKSGFIACRLAKKLEKWGIPAEKAVFVLKLTDNSPKVGDWGA
jgi:hypothetical protein